MSNNDTENATIYFVSMTDIGNKMAIRWYLREWRKHCGLTQQQAADRIGTTKTQVSKLERGPRIKDGQQMSDKWIAAFAYAYGITPADLLRHPDRPTPNDLLREAPEEKKRLAIIMIEGLLKAG